MDHERVCKACQVALAQAVVAGAALLPAGSHGLRLAAMLTGACGLKALCQYEIPLQPYTSSLGRLTADGHAF